MKPENIAAIIDHTYLKTLVEGASLLQQEIQVKKLIEEAIKYKAYSVCIREHMVSFAKKIIQTSKSDLKICSVIGFPVGDNYKTDEKIKLLQTAKNDGADEFDMVFNYKSYLNGDIKSSFDDLLTLSREAGSATLKVIFENTYLPQNKKIEIYQLAINAFEKSGFVNNRFLKTSTGFAQSKNGSPIGATIEDVRLMHTISKGKFGIKPAGGIQDFKTAIDFFNAVGSPTLKTNEIDPMKFRIGSSSLLQNIFGKESLNNY